MKALYYKNGPVATLGDLVGCIAAGGKKAIGELTQFLPPGDGAEAIVTLPDGTRQQVIIGNCKGVLVAGECI